MRRLWACLALFAFAAETGATDPRVTSAQRFADHIRPNRRDSVPVTEHPDVQGTRQAFTAPPPTATQQDLAQHKGSSSNRKEHRREKRKEERSDVENGKASDEERQDLRRQERRHERRQDRKSTDSESAVDEDEEESTKHGKSRKKETTTTSSSRSSGKGHHKSGKHAGNHAASHTEEDEETNGHSSGSHKSGKSGSKSRSSSNRGSSDDSTTKGHDHSHKHHASHSSHADSQDSTSDPATVSDQSEASDAALATITGAPTMAPTLAPTAHCDNICDYSIMGLWWMTSEILNRMEGDVNRTLCEIEIELEIIVLEEFNGCNSFVDRKFASLVDNSMIQDKYDSMLLKWGVDRPQLSDTASSDYTTPGTLPMSNLARSDSESRQSSTIESLLFESDSMGSASPVATSLMIVAAVLLGMVSGSRSSKQTHQIPKGSLLP